jgi:aromatic ring hydroxylase
VLPELIAVATCPRTDFTPSSRISQVMRLSTTLGYNCARSDHTIKAPVATTKSPVMCMERKRMPVRSGAEYVAGLQDGRHVWYRGEPVEDITVHPAFVSNLQVMAELYDLQHHPTHRQALTYPSPQTGTPVGQSFRMPRGVEDLALRRSMHHIWAFATGGMLVQTPDYANVGLMALASARDLLATGDPRFGVHALRYYEQCREHDWCVAHIPAVAASQSSEAAMPSASAFRVTTSQSAGLRVSGMCKPGPLAPLADELLICGGAGLKSGQGQHALAFALPVDTPGISLLCQATYSRSSAGSHQLAAQFDMPDCVLLFEDVLVPWERVFLSGNVKLHNRLMAATGFAAHVGHQVLTRQVSKTTLLLGMAEQLSREIGMASLLHVQAKLGELITTLEAMRSCLRRAEVDAVAGPGGAWMPEGSAIRAGQRLFAGFQPHMVDMLQLLGANGYAIHPSHADLQGPMSEALAEYDQGAGVPADEQLQLFRLAWDVLGDRGGVHAQIYDPDAPADVVRAMASDYQSYNLQAAVARAQAFFNASGYKTHATPSWTPQA